MGVISYVFVVRGLSHTHELTAADLQAGRARRLHGEAARWRAHQPRAAITGTR